MNIVNASSYWYAKHVDELTANTMAIGLASFQVLPSLVGEPGTESVYTLK